MIISVGYRLRTDNLRWRHPLILIGSFFLTCTTIALVVQVVYVAIKGPLNDIRPLKILFVVALIFAIVTDMTAFAYTFLPLICQRKEMKVLEGLSKTTALGIWFFATQGTFYIIQVAIYIWFVSIQRWDLFVLLLSVDYVVRFAQYLFYIWPPPDSLITFLASRLLNVSVHTSSDINKPPNLMPPETYTKISSA
ncbi:hypothetical protein BY458DRAFT_433122 [Sporodiniella umbellata]|nr:hypothetical protein BY458DRAFT_433122 [Sporodiniella umbellata]